jgi:hypothetical protein
VSRIHGSQEAFDSTLFRPLEDQQMRKLTNLGSAFVVAAFVAAGVVAFDAPVFAAGPGSTRSNAVHCALLAAAEASVSALPETELTKAALVNINERQAALGCGA